MVTLVTPAGSFGGPVRVAVNQSRALIERGHDVTVVAGTSGYRHPPTEQDGVPVRLFPARQAVPKTGFAGLTSPAMIRWFVSHRKNFDVVHVHLARDLVTMPMARLASVLGLGLVVQTHGMIDATDKLLARPLDAFFTRPILRRATAGLYLTEREHGDLVSVAGQQDSRLHWLTNGVPETAVDAAQRTTPPEVLFLARLQSRKRPLMFVAMARELLEQGMRARFTLVGPDEGEGAAVRGAIEASGHADSISWEGAASPDETLARMRRASVYVLPSVDEPYPMSVLEAMSVGLPVVVTDSCGLAPAISRSGSGIVVDHSHSALVDAVRRLTTDGEARADFGARAHDTIGKEFGMSAVATKLEQVYRDACTLRDD
ncbi:glycosyl transferase family 1 [Rhodococcoides trifolii]|uniref:Glycosyl transferase family 1 n=1 Tax=Rhodococcoides trifolii TaxID=908250 RepID=A0A917G8N7_9NOCA|nr:glycosyl transferase family 1 [Rhodococcus trifolii]